jgi:hypothetical protein
VPTVILVSLCGWTAAERDERRRLREVFEAAHEEWNYYHSPSYRPLPTIDDRRNAAGEALLFWRNGDVAGTVADVAAERVRLEAEKGRALDAFREYEDWLDAKYPPTEATPLVRRSGYRRGLSSARPGWSSTRVIAIRRAGNACEVCGHSENVNVHHVKPRSLGGTDDPSNLRVLCPNHHAAAHAALRRGRVAA